MASTSSLILPSPSRRQLLVGATAVAATGFTASRASAGVPAAPAAPAYIPSSTSSAVAPARVRGWAADTWHSLVAMTDEKTGLPGDNIPESLAAKDRSGYTSPTNIGGYLWSAIVARELGIISRGECTSRLLRTLRTVERMEHHEPSGMYYNWYDESTGAKLTAFPGSGDRIDPFLSSVDNGWLGAALRVVRASDTAAGLMADRIFRRMRWDMFYDTNASRKPGLIHGGFFPEQPPNRTDGFWGN